MRGGEVEGGDVGSRGVEDGVIGGDAVEGVIGGALKTSEVYSKGGLTLGRDIVGKESGRGR